MDMFSTAIILAGGLSSRMGFDKQLIEINQTKLIYTLIEKLNNIFEDIIIVTNKPELYKNIGAIVVSDIIMQKGPLSGIHSGLSISKSKYAYVVACDMPNLNPSYIEFMKDELERRKAYGCITKYGDWIEPFNAFYSVYLKEGIKEYLSTGRRSIYGFLKEFNIIYISEKDAREFSPNWDMFLNLNTCEDLYDYIDTQS